MQIDFNGQTVVVTGGTGALGHATVGLLLAAGARVVVPALDEKEAERATYAADERVRIVVSGSLADEGNAERFFGTVGALWASIQIAGGFAMSPLTETSLGDFRAMMQLNAESCFLACREATRRMRARGDGSGGRLVNVAARPVLAPVGGMVAYSASKAAVATITTSLAEELKAERVWVNAVVPSIMNTPANRAAMPQANHALWPSTEDVARTIVFLASPQNATTSGALVPVYGGA